MVFQRPAQQGFITNQRDPYSALFDGQQSPGNQLLMTMVTGHGIQGYLHSSLLGYFRVKDNNGAAFVFAAFATETMRLLGLAARGAERESRGGQGIVGPAQPGTGTGMTSFW
jgi:hypothetical protein